MKYINHYAANPKNMSYYGISSYDDLENYIKKNLNYEEIWKNEKFRIFDELYDNYIKTGEIKGIIETTKKYNKDILDFFVIKLKEMNFFVELYNNAFEQHIIIKGKLNS